MGSDTTVVTQKIFQLIGLTNAVSVCFCICLCYLNNSQTFFMTLPDYTYCVKEGKYIIILSFSFLTV